MGFREENITAPKLSEIMNDPKAKTIDQEIASEKVILSDDAYAICECLTKLLEKHNA